MTVSFGRCSGIRSNIMETKPVPEYDCAGWRIRGKCDNIHKVLRKITVNRNFLIKDKILEGEKYHEARNRYMKPAFMNLHKES